MEPREPEPRDASSTGPTSDHPHEKDSRDVDSDVGSAVGSDDDAEQNAAQDSDLDSDGDAEETKMLGIDQRDATESSATSYAPEDDPDWRPGMLPRDWAGRTGDRPAPAPAAASGRTDRDTARFFATSASASNSAGVPGRSVRGDVARRHGFDPMAMVAGVTFMAIAVMYMLDAGDTVDARPGLMLALAVIGVGASGFVGAVWAMVTGRRRRRAATAGAEARAVDLTKAG